MDACYCLERLVEIAEQSYEVVRRRTILDRSEAATIKRRVRAKLRVAAMMKKMSLPEASAAPAVVALHAVRGAVRGEGCIRAGRDGRRAVD